jgi:iron complex outermembrane receptor protein
MGLKLPFYIQIKDTGLNIVLEATKEDIKSTNLGKHSRYRFSLASSLKGNFKDYLYLLSLRWDEFNKWKGVLSPSLYLGYRLKDGLIYTSIQKGFRIPSFTELYYWSPANQGSQNLEPEECLNIEIGYKRQAQPSYGFSLFRRFGYDMIDWVRDEPNQPWQARNISFLKTDGFEFWLKFKDLRFSYSHLDTNYKTSANFSKYIANYLEHKFCLSWNLIWHGYESSFEISYQERPQRSGTFNVDLCIAKPFKLRNYNLKAFLKISNLTNSKQEEIEGVSLPGRWMFLGMEVNF